MTKFFLINFLTLLSFSLSMASNFSDTLSIEQEMSDEELMERYYEYIDSIAETLTYETGTVSIGNGIALLHVPDDFKYLNGESSDMILTDIWGNPPPEKGYESLGMLVPAKGGALADSAYQINITFSEEGYISDKDAKKLDYDELLESMQEGEDEMNAYRESQGYPSMNLIDWAATPHYESDSKKLYWAKELEFGGDPIHTLNYNIRILGRKGYLELNAIGTMDMLPKVEAEIENILSSVNFNDGHKYADFNPDIDKVAAYGIGGLIAGKMLLKAGILAKLGILLAKFWKVILIALAAGGAGFRKFFRRKGVVNVPPSDGNQD